MKTDQSEKVQETLDHLKLLPLDVSSAFVGVPDEISSDVSTGVSGSAALLVVTSSSSVVSSSGLSSAETNSSSNFVSAIHTINRDILARRRLSICRRTAWWVWNHSFAIKPFWDTIIWIDFLYAVKYTSERYWSNYNSELIKMLWNWISIVF